MRNRVGRFIVFAAAPLILTGTTGCATKGFVRKEIATNNTSLRSAMDSAIAAERVARIAGDSMTAAQAAALVAELRNELTQLRTEFGAKITAMEEGVRFAMPVNFAFDDASVRESDKPALTRFAQVAQRYYGGSAITVEGFADPAGPARYNQVLSERRAETVRQFLGAQGLDGSQLRAVGYGETRQVVPGAERDDPGGEQNRRVVFVIESRGSATIATAESGPQPRVGTP